jgi:hypothetical protein
MSFVCLHIFLLPVSPLQEGDKAGSGTTWEQILKAQDFKRRSFSDIDRNQDGYVDAKVRCAVLAAAPVLVLAV